MALIVPKPIETVRHVKVQIGAEWTAIDFGREVPREYAVQRAKEALEALAGPTKEAP